MITFDCPTVLELQKDMLWWDIYEESFPPSEREPKEIILKTVKENLGFALRALDNGQTVGIATIHLLRNSSMVFLVYLATTSKLRSKGIGRELMEKAWEVGKEVLAKEGFLAKGLVWESSHFESASTEQEKQNHIKREAFYLRQGAETLLSNYFQPPVDGNTLIKMKLFYRPSTLTKNLLNQEIIDQEMIKQIVKSIYSEKYHKANGISEKVLSELEGQFI